MQKNGLPISKLGAIVFCQNCGAHTLADANFCKSCGVNFKSPVGNTGNEKGTAPKSKWWWKGCRIAILSFMWLFGVGGILLVWLTLIFSDTSLHQNSSAGSVLLGAALCYGAINWFKPPVEGKSMFWRGFGTAIGIGIAGILVIQTIRLFIHY